MVFAVLYLGLLRRTRGHTQLMTYMAIYAFSCVLLLSMSGVYHLLPEGDGRAVLRRLDQAAIFVLIAGTHTPIQGLFFQGFWRWGVICFMWSVAITGITLFSIFGEEIPLGVGTGTYLILSWIGATSGIVIWKRHGFKLIRPLVLGGVAYTTGAAILAFGWPRIVPGIIGPHELWHVAVLIAVSLHWRFMHGVTQAVQDRTTDEALSAAILVD